MKSARNLVPKASKGAGQRSLDSASNGVSFGDSNPDEATRKTGIHKGAKNPRHEHIRQMLVRK